MTKNLNLKKPIRELQKIIQIGELCSKTRNSTQEFQNIIQMESTIYKV